MPEIYVKNKEQGLLIMLKFYEYMPTIMEYLADASSHSSKEIRKFCCDKLSISVEEQQVTISSGESVVHNRINWAITYLKKSRLIENEKRGVYKITQRGRKATEKGAKYITLEYLKQFKEFNEFQHSDKTQEKNNDISETLNTENPESPQEQIENAVLKLNSSLADDLMMEIKRISPYDFERLVVQLLVKMGYGSLSFNSDEVTKKSGDEGIDGIISADRFGFDTVYVQAKQWDKASVGRPEIQKFLGALAGQGAAKGLFITTSHFTKDAIDYANKNLQSKIVLVDGEELCNLMIEYDLGVSTVEIYKIKRIDSDYFNNEF